MKPARILLLVVAIVAGGLAAFLATRGTNTPSQPVQTAKVTVTKTRVLVANQDIGVGQRIGPAFVEWQDWPESALRSEYVTDSALPDAPDQLTGAIARFEIFPGEPILETKLVRSDQGYMSAVLPKGMRAVSLPVTAASSAGGFIVPNDHVDVVKTTSQGGVTQTETVLQNVKVLAIGVKLGETGTTGGSVEPAETPSDKVFKNSTIATLELTPNQAAAVVAASRDEQLTLVLRSVADFGEMPGAVPQSQTVRMIRFGQQSAVVPGGGASSAGSEFASSTGPDLANTNVDISPQTVLDSAQPVDPQTNAEPPLVQVQ